MSTDVNLKNLISSMRKSSRFGVFSKDGSHLATNTHFLVELNDDELWEVQAALRMREVNFWYQFALVNKKVQLVKYDSRQIQETILELRSIIMQNNMITLVDTGLYSSFENTQISFFARRNDYACIDAKYLSIFDCKTLEQQDEDGQYTPILINRKHLITPIRTENIKYLKDLSKGCK